MAAVTACADLVEQVLEVYTKIPYAHGDLTCEAIFDRPRGRFVLMTLGWDGEERVDHPLVHIDIIDGKLWIQTDHTEHGIASELWVYVAMDAPVKFSVLKLRNVSGRPRRLRGAFQNSTAPPRR